jgi:hypothetical protein
MSDRATVDYIADANVGDLVWFVNDIWRGHAPELRRVDEIKTKYSRSGTYEFDKSNGHARSERGFSPSHRFFGEIELWERKNRHVIIEAVKQLSAIDLMRVAEVLGVPSPTKTGER